VLDVMLEPGFLEDVERKGRLLRGELDTVARDSRRCSWKPVVSACCWG